MTIDEILRRARSELDRVTPAQAWAAMGAGAVLADIRPEFQRRADGEIPGGVVIERVHLEWRCDPASPARVPEAVDHDVRWIVCCDEGYSSSLAAASLRALELHRATDVIDGLGPGGLRDCRSYIRRTPPSPGCTRPDRAPVITLNSDGVRPVEGHALLGVPRVLANAGDVARHERLG